MPLTQLAAENRMEAAYAQRYRELWDYHWWWRARRAFVEQQITQLSRGSKFGKILDIGCGDGLFFDFLEKFGAVHGIESDPRIVSPEKQDRQIEIGPFDDTYQSDDRYDLILMLDVLEHIEEDRYAASRVYDLLEPGGFFLLTVPAFQTLWSQHDVINGHFRRYTQRRLVALLEAEHFQVTSSGYLFLWALLPLAIRRWLYPAKHSPDQSTYGVQAPGRNHLSQIPYYLSRFEQTLGSFIPLPAGTSCFLIGQKPYSSEIRRTKPR
jgi:2-polyprenyl-3-methyl-5-hydroxy-6-metoxy-1,4-benzoquinol methylase